MKKRYRTKFKQWNEHKELLCYKCQLYKNIEEFNISGQNSDKFYRENRDKRCKECKKKQYDKRKLNNRGKKDLGRLLLERWHGLKDRNKKHNIELNFDWTYLKILWENQNGLCAISNIPMTYEINNGRVPTNLSVDKIDCKLPYSKNNIQLVCMAVNQMKSDMTIAQLIYFCKNIIENNEH